MKILAFVPCEDIRPELGGKVTLIGATDGIALDGSKVASWPVSLRAAGYLRFQVERSEPVPSEVMIRVTFGETEVFITTVPIVVPRPDLPSSVSLGMVLVPVNGQGTIKFTYSFRKHGERSWDPFVFDVPVEVQNLPTKST
jgi:hypothetical protein